MSPYVLETPTFPRKGMAVFHPLNYRLSKICSCRSRAPFSLLANFQLRANGRRSPFFLAVQYIASVCVCMYGWMDEWMDGWMDG